MAAGYWYTDGNRASGVMMSDFSQLLATQGKPYYLTDEGAAYLGDSLDAVRKLPDESIDLIVTSPPFALRKKKEYGNVDAAEYIAWFVPFAEQFHRVLKATGSLVIHIGGSWNKGLPTKSLYQYKLLIELCETFHLAHDFYWFNPAKLPSPAEWVTVRKIRVKDAVDLVWWLSKTPFPKADNQRILRRYSESMEKLLKNGYKSKKRPSGHDISPNFSKSNGGAIPPNIFTIANTDSNGYYLRACREAGLKVHPARYPIAIPEFFIRFLSEPGDTVLEPFAGSNTTGESAEQLGRHWLAFELNEEYLRGSSFRFDGLQKQLIREPRSDYAETE